MDFTHLQTLLNNIQPRPDKIKALVDYIMLNTSSNEAQIAKTIEKEFQYSSADKQLAIFYSISEILLLSNQKREAGYFKVFAIKVKTFLEVLSKQMVDIRVMKDITRTIQKWQQQQMFAPSFMQKLRGSIRHLYSKLQQSYLSLQQQQRSFQFKKYKKTFLTQLSDLRQYPLCQKLYQQHCNYTELEQKLMNINNQYQKLEKLAVDDYQYQEKEILRFTELKAMYKDVADKIQATLINLHKHFNQMREWTMQQYEQFKQDYDIKNHK